MKETWESVTRNMEFNRLERERRIARLLQVGWVFVLLNGLAFLAQLILRPVMLPDPPIVLLWPLCVGIAFVVLFVTFVMLWIVDSVYNWIMGLQASNDEFTLPLANYLYRLPLTLQERREAKRELQKRKTHQLEREIRELDDYLRKEGVIV